MIARLLLVVCCLTAVSQLLAADELPGTRPLDWQGDLSVRMLDGAHQYIERKIDESVAARAKFWKHDLTSRVAYEGSIAPNRARLKKIIGVVDERVPAAMERFGDDDNAATVGESERIRAYQVRWPVLTGVFGEGLLLEPKSASIAGRVIVVPDADQTPEQLAGLAAGVEPRSQLARRFAENGFQVLVPTLLGRDDECSGNPRIRLTNQTHREWIYRQAFHMGRHPIGYEVQKVLAAVDWTQQRGGDALPVGVAGYGEGGLIALYAAAVDPRIDAALVSGYFTSRQRVWEEPIYRNVWGLLREFGDAEIATLIAPRGLVIEYSAAPEIPGPPPVRMGRTKSAADGKLATPSLDAVMGESSRIESLLKPDFQPRELVIGPNKEPLPFGSEEAAARLAEMLGVKRGMRLSDDLPRDRRLSFDPKARQRRALEQLQDHVQRLVRDSERVRDEYFTKSIPQIRDIGMGAPFSVASIPTTSADAFAASAKKYKDDLWHEVLGKLEDPITNPNARARKILDNPKWTAYEVVLDVWPEVFAWGVLLMPNDLKPGERRPVVVCQHGRNGVPLETIHGNVAAYRDFAAKLCERGFITFSPHNLYRGEDRYRWLSRKANGIKASMFSVIIAQHDQILRWLGTLPFADKERIGFYGLSYGGETAMRVPTLLDGYTLSICSGDFNDWTKKITSVDDRFSFMFTIEWEMPYFNMGNTFNYAELAALMVPRPFMVERGHHDRVAPDTWVASEYAKVRWLYTQLGLADKTQIEFFNGGHTINGQATFGFLHKHLHWPQ